VQRSTRERPDRLGIDDARSGGGVPLGARHRSGKPFVRFADAGEVGVGPGVDQEVDARDLCGRVEERFSLDTGTVLDVDSYRSRGNNLGDGRRRLR
jgi:hypothetical protein